jgi:hypothetical protein
VVTHNKSSGAAKGSSAGIRGRIIIIFSFQDMVLCHCKDSRITQVKCRTSNGPAATINHKEMRSDKKQLDENILQNKPSENVKEQPKKLKIL